MRSQRRDGIGKRIHTYMSSAWWCSVVAAATACAGTWLPHLVVYDCVERPCSVFACLCLRSGSNNNSKLNRPGLSRGGCSKL